LAGGDDIATAVRTRVAVTVVLLHIPADLLGIVQDLASWCEKKIFSNHVYSASLHCGLNLTAPGGASPSCFHGVESTVPCRRACVSHVASPLVRFPSVKCPTVSYVPNEFIDADSEPSGIAVRIHLYVSSQFFQIGPFPIISFLRTWSGITIICSHENMIIFMLNKVIGELCFIGKTEDVFQVTVKAHFLH